MKYQNCPKLTPVMTAPLDELRDTRRKDSSTTLKPMTTTAQLRFLYTGQQLLMVDLSPHTGSPAPELVMKGFSTPRGDTHTLPLFIPFHDPPNAPPSLPMSEVSPRLSPKKLRNRIHPNDG